MFMLTSRRRSPSTGSFAIAERSAVTAGGQREVNPAALAYINRLSDLLFVLARVANDDGRADVKWVPGQNR